MIKIISKFDHKQYLGQYDGLAGRHYKYIKNMKIMLMYLKFQLDNFKEQNNIQKYLRID